MAALTPAKTGANDSAVDVDTFYKHRIENFQSERDIIGKYISSITPNKGELHVLDWEYRAGIDNAASAVAEREKITSDLKKTTREIMNTKQELERLQTGQEYRITQIQRLSELSQPVQRDTTYVIKDRYASRASINMYSGVTITDGHIGLDDVSLSSESSREAGQAGVGSASGSGRRVSKKAVNSSRNVIKSLRTGEVMMLENRLDEETRKLHSGIEELETALKEVKIGTKALDKVVMASLDATRAEAAALIKDVDRMDHQGYLSVSELLTLRLKILEAQRMEIEELAQLRSDKDFFSARETQMREQLISDMSLMKRRLKAEAANSTKDFHAQSLQLDRQILKLKKKAAFLRDEAARIAKSGRDENTEKVQAALDSAENRYSRLLTRYRLEKEGYQSEAALLRKRLVALDVQYKKIKDNNGSNSPSTKQSQC